VRGCRPRGRLRSRTLTPSATILRIEARDLDTDERKCNELRVPAPGDVHAQRRQLCDCVGNLHPEARMRSFAGAAATFLDGTHLIVAHYPDLPRTGRAGAHGADGLQTALFGL